MAVTAQRRLVTQDVSKFGSGRESFDHPDLTQIQTESYERFLQYNGGSSAKRKSEGLEAVLQEIFPIESYDKTIPETLQKIKQLAESFAASTTLSAGEKKRKVPRPLSLAWNIAASDAWYVANPL